MSGAPASLLFPALLTLLVYLAALFVVASSRALTAGPRPVARTGRLRGGRRGAPRLRVIQGGAGRSGAGVARGPAFHAR